MPKTTQGSTVSLDLEVLDAAGEAIEFTEEGEPLVIEIGGGELPPTVEEALIGKSEGDEVDVTCPPGEAFGDHSPEAIVSVPREDFPEDLTLEKGTVVEMTIEDDDGSTSEVDAHIVEVNAEAVMLDANHPLAGREARFRMKIVKVEGDD